MSKWRVWEFLQDNTTLRFSSTRLFALGMGSAFVADYINTRIGLGEIFEPSWTTVGVVLGSLGIKFAQSQFAEHSVPQRPVPEITLTSK